VSIPDWQHIKCINIKLIIERNLNQKNSGYLGRNVLDPTLAYSLAGMRQHKK
jgi:hypothetical protein